MDIRQATVEDWQEIWPIFHEVVSAGDSYPYSPETTKGKGYRLWMEKPERTYLCELDGEVVGTYYIKPNQPGLGSHVCNCGYMVASEARGRGVATEMCRHSQQLARELGYDAMQFNLVVASNERAVRLWRHLGFETIGRLPKAFRTPEGDYQDAFVYYKLLK
ncbi:MAG: N-acetyltransferase family protein [Anaerolineales bacterium]